MATNIHASSSAPKLPEIFRSKFKVGPFREECRIHAMIQVPDKDPGSPVFGSMVTSPIIAYGEEPQLERTVFPGCI